MAEGSWKLIAVCVVLAVGSGLGTALVLVPGIGPPGGPVVAGPDLRLERENRDLREQVRELQRQVAETRLELAALKAFPRTGTREAPAANDLREADEMSLRAALERASRVAPFDESKREEVVRILLDASGRMRALRERRAGAPGGDAEAAAEAEELGKETRRRIEEALSPEQVRALDGVLGGLGPSDGAGR